MIETKFFFTPFEPPVLAGSNSVSYEAPVWLQSPEFLRDHGDGWVPVNHTYYKARGKMFTSLMLTREITIPDSPE